MTINFRQFGGQASSFGGRVRAGGLYRGAAPIDDALLAHHDFALIGDLRHPAESPVSWPSRWRERLVSSQSLAATQPPHLAMLDGKPLTAEGIREYYIGIYRDFPLSASYGELFGAIIRALASLDGDRSALICCSAGKDRTGILVALIGRLLGVSDEHILADYLLTNSDPSSRQLLPLAQRHALNATGQAISPALAEVLIGASGEYLASAFGAIDETYGGIDGYCEAIGVSASDIASLRANWLR